MARIANLKNHAIGDKQGIYPSWSTSGDQITPETVDSVDVIRMAGLGIGIMNSGTSQVTLNVILAGNDASVVLPVVLAPNESWQGGFFNAVAVSGSTGYDSSTTHYLYA